MVSKAVMKNNESSPHSFGHELALKPAKSRQA